MTEKVGGHSAPDVRDARKPAKTGGPASARATTRAGAPPGDEVSLTAQVQRLRELETSLAADPAFDATRVEALQEVIDNGQYRVNARSVAEHLLEFESELFG